MEISLNQYSVFLSWCVTSVVNIIIMFNIFLMKPIKKTELKINILCLKIIMVLAILEENTHHLLVVEALFWLF